MPRTASAATLPSTAPRPPHGPSAPDPWPATGPRDCAPASAALALAALALPAPALAALPMAVDGQQLPSLAPMLERVTPAVVNISAQDEPDPQARMAGGGRQNVGSGVIVDAAQGNILTNHHVVRGASAIRVRCRTAAASAPRSWAATPIPTWPCCAFPPRTAGPGAVRFQRSARGRFRGGHRRSLRPGAVRLVGHRFGAGPLEPARGRLPELHPDRRFHQSRQLGRRAGQPERRAGRHQHHDHTPSGGNVGIGFAIPSNLAAEVMRQLLQHGQVQRGGLGLDTLDITPRNARQRVWRSAPVAVAARGRRFAGAAGRCAGARPDRGGGRKAGFHQRPAA